MSGSIIQNIVEERLVLGGNNEQQADQSFARQAAFGRAAL
jgi:hypothetical protein